MISALSPDEDKTVGATHNLEVSFGKMRQAPKIKELIEKNEILQEIIQQNDQLLAILSHDIRNPLASLQHLIKLLSSVSIEPNQLQHFFSDIDRQIGRIFDMVDATLVLKSSELKQFNFEQRPINVFFFLSRIKQYFEGEILKKNIDFSIAVSEDAVVKFDIFVLEVIIRNIISNALKYTPAGGRVNIRMKEVLTAWDIVVSDSGPGMSADQVAKLLNNKSARTERKQIRDGLGLGLIMARECLLKNFGQLLVESVPGQGTSFIIRIPKHIA